MRRILRWMLYLLLALLILWFLLIQLGCFTMRTSDADWRLKIYSAGGFLEPFFLHVPATTQRSIHAVAVSAADSLPLVILVHGSPGASDAYVDYLTDNILNRAARLVAIDRPGFGYTSGFGQPEPSQQAQAAAVLAVADQLSPGRRVILVGHSLGGPVISRFAMDYPERTAGLVIVAGSIDPTQEEHPWWQTAVDLPPIKWLVPKPAWTSNSEIIDLEKELETMLPLWPRITCPVRVIHAVNDRLVPFANVAFAQRMLSNCPDLQVEVLQEGDHFILWSHRAQVRAAILGLL